MTFNELSRELDRVIDELTNKEFILYQLEIEVDALKEKRTSLIGEFRRRNNNET